MTEQEDTTAPRKRMWEKLFPGQKFPGDEEADGRIEDFITSTVEWQWRIERAHDLLARVGKSHDAHKLMPSLRRGLQDSHDTLCWVLGHHNESFKTTLELVEMVLRSVGSEPPEVREAQ